MSADPFPPLDGTDPAQPETPARPNWTKLDSAWLFLLALSGFATFEGLMSLVSSGGAEVTVLSYVFSFTVVLVMIATMGLTAERAFGKKRHEVSPVSRILAGLVYAGIALFSLMLAFSWWWTMLGARGATDGQIDRQVIQAESFLGNAREQLRSAKTAVGQLATISSERAETERNQGRTCGPQGRGEGAIFTLRSGNAAFFQQVSDDVGTRIDSLDQAMTASLGRIATLRKRAETAPSAERAAALGEVSKELKGLSGLLAALAGDPSLSAYRQEMQGLSAAFRSPNGHRDNAGQPFTCIDPGLATALDGASKSLGGIKPMPIPEIKVYEGTQSTLEAMRRFIATLFGWLAPETLGEGISGGNEYLAFALGILVDVLLLWIIIERGGDSGPSSGFRLRRASMEIAERRERREVEHLLSVDRAIAYATSIATIEASSALPFSEVMIEHDGKTYLLIPRIAPNEQAAAKAGRMLRIARQMDQLRHSGVKELVSRVSKLTGRHERRARNALRDAGARSAAWAGGARFVWFEISQAGLQNLASWIEALSLDGAREERAAPFGTGRQDNTQGPAAPWLLTTTQ